ncbi:MAG: GNAT family N-acetyltransferase [Candidatus Cybelea sp.]
MRSIPNNVLQVDPISQASLRPALEYLARSPYLNVFISHVLLHESASSVRKNVVVVTGERGIAGVAYHGRQIVIAAEPPAIAPLAAYLLRHSGNRMIVGPRDTVREFWRIAGRAMGRPRLVRDRQFVMMVDPARLRRCGAIVTVRHAEMDEWRAVAESSASMIRQELEYDPRRNSVNFNRAIREMIDRRLWWVGVTSGRLCFFCNIGPWSEQTAQLQGIWTPPELRGQGLAAASLAAICDRLFEITPTLSLYVNDFNDAAIALYRRLGFENVGDFQTILF